MLERITSGTAFAIVLIAILGKLTGLLSPEWVRALWNFSLFIVLVFLLAYGSLLENKKSWVPLLAAHVLFVIAFWMQVNLDQPGGSGTFYKMGFLAIGMLYSSHFYDKKQKQLSDWLKVVFVWVAYGSRYFIIMEWEHGDTLMDFSSSLLWIIFALFAWKNRVYLFAIKPSS
ncbi:hypothetical protein N9933_02200 [bacterium]|nr:hypothetical protein [bacterium]